MPTKKQDSFAESALGKRLKAPIKPSDTVSVAWECAHCGKRHLWTWHRVTADDWSHSKNGVAMRCVACDANGARHLRQIGRDAYAACWVR